MINRFHNFSHKGSVTLMAFMVLGVIFVIGLAFRQFTINSVLQIYRFKTNEISLSMGDGLLDISKKIAESQANDSGSLGGVLDQMAKDNVDESEKIKLFSIDRGVVSGASGDYKDFIDKLVGEQQEKLSGEAFIVLKKESGFPIRAGIDESNIGGEFKGTAILTVSFSLELKISYKNKSSKKITTSPRTMKTTFEFKRVRLQAPVVSHFTFFGKNLKGQSSGGANYTGGAFNNLDVNSEGDRYTGGKNTNPSFSYLTLNNGSLTSVKSSQQSFKDVGYIYLGTGGDDAQKIYLNLTAGKANASESFHLYRGEPGESDFYRLFTADYRLILKDDINKSSHKSQIDKVKLLLSPEKGSKYKDSASNGIPFYYLSRKDYGYSAAWEKHPEFGFERGKRIPANNFHLFGSGEDHSFSVVFGNVYRRCLSLAGYKQRKAAGRKKESKRSFEFQAGPIYFYGNYKELHAHKLYINEKITQSSGASKISFRNDPRYAPIEVWDQRMNWAWPGANEAAEKINGSWVFVSGDGLMGRLVPSISKFYEKFPNFLDPSIGIKKREVNVYNESSMIASTRPDNVVRFVSPMIEAIFKNFNKNFPKLFKERNSKLAWTNDANQLSAYYKELLLMFYYNSYQAILNYSIDVTEATIENFDAYGNDDKMIKSAALRWLEITEMVVDTKNPAYLLKQPWITGSGTFASKSKAIKMRKWNPKAGGIKDGKLHYFTLPDPWLSETENPDGLDTKIEETIDGESNYLKGLRQVDSGGGGSEIMFNDYFRRLMTDPAWVLPYNYSSRFYFKELKTIFFQKKGVESSKTRDEEMEDIIPEIRDAIGYVGNQNNKYMGGNKGAPLPLNEEVQRNIFKFYKEQKLTDKGYYFVKEMTAGSLAEVELDSLYDGRCIFKFENQAELIKRLEKTNNQLNTVVCMTKNLELPLPNNMSIRGNGVIHVANLLTIKGDLKFDGQVVLIAKKITLKSRPELENISLIQTGATFNPNFKTLSGNLVVDKLSPNISGEPVITYNKGLKNKDYVVSFQPFINTWEMCGSLNKGC